MNQPVSIRQTKEQYFLRQRELLACLGSLGLQTSKVLSVPKRIVATLKFLENCTILQNKWLLIHMRIMS